MNGLLIIALTILCAVVSDEATQVARTRRDLDWRKDDINSVYIYRSGPPNIKDEEDSPREQEEIKPLSNRKVTLGSCKKLKKRAYKTCKKVCKKAIKAGCSEFDCSRILKKILKKACKRKCKKYFRD